MPARKSNASAASNEDPAPAKSTSKDDTLSVEDLNLPKSIVQRLGKGVLPPNTQIQKDALLAMSKSATVFVNYITSCAAEHALRNGKKTVMPKDVFDAMTELEFDFMLPRLEAEVTKFTSIQADKRNTYRKKVREEKKAAVPKDENAPATPNGNAAPGEDSEPAAKRARRSSVGGDHQSGSEMEDNDETADVEDEEVEDDEIEEEVVEEGLTEDPLEEREQKDEDDEMGDGDESD
ncbi:histone-fold-containing protein [Pyrenochaeta sp. MPI-SDFR-AT-0127]|nr:histone-fold-containing protein [Pyrenochaeta sp. MPI-SDFR-AT-0127]